MNAIPQLRRDGSRARALDPGVIVYALIDRVREYLGNRVHREELSRFGTEPSGVQLVGDRLLCDPLGSRLEAIANGGSGSLVELDLMIDDLQAEREVSSGRKTFESGFSHSLRNDTGEAAGIRFRHSLVNALENYSLVARPYALLGGKHPDAEALELLLVDSAIVTVPREAVETVDDYKSELPFFASSIIR